MLDFAIILTDYIALMQYGGDYHMQSGTVLGHIYLSLDSGYGRTQWRVADPGLCMIVYPHNELFN